MVLDRIMAGSLLTPELVDVTHFKEDLVFTSLVEVLEFRHDAVRELPQLLFQSLLLRLHIYLDFAL